MDAIGVVAAVVFVLVFAASVVGYLRRRDTLTGAVALLFASTAPVFIGQLLKRCIRSSCRLRSALSRSWDCWRSPRSPSISLRCCIPSRGGCCGRRFSATWQPPLPLVLLPSLRPCWSCSGAVASLRRDGRRRRDLLRLRGRATYRQCQSAPTDRLRRVDPHGDNFAVRRRCRGFPGGSQPSPISPA